MANLILPDSSFYIRCTRDALDPFIELGRHTEEWEFATCGMVVLEVCRGIRPSSELALFRERFAVMLYIPTTSTIWERATHLAWSLDRQGMTLPAQDLMIAAHALQAEATVLTYDSHFHSIPGLRVTDRLG